MKQTTRSIRQCRLGDCQDEVPPALSGEGMCLDHFAEAVIRRADQIRVQCLEAKPVDQRTLDWLFADAPHVIQALSNGGLGEDSAKNEKVLEILLCLANLRDYITHHSVRVNRSK